jgi:hypothetical protein
VNVAGLAIMAAALVVALRAASGVVRACRAA